MKTFQRLLLFLFTSLPFFSSAQSNPLPLKPGITISRILTVQDGSIRVIKDPISGNLFYSTTDGRIYEVLRPAQGAAYDSLVFTTSDHHVTYSQGFTVHDSTFYISGNDSSNTSLTFGIIVRGVLQPNGTRLWSTVMQTDFYQTADYFDHLFSGIAVTPSGDSIVICSGARGDHGEVETRYGLYPGLRNVPLTSNVYIVPAHDTSVVVLHNDSSWNDTTTLLYARGVRNTFDMAYDSQGRLFGVENSGDRDHNEEMNWLRRGHHYGFPWVMGDTDNPQQYPGFVPATDLLISHYSRSWRIGAWSNDPSYPPPPAFTLFDSPIQNFGPDADKYRDESAGTVVDASDSLISIGTFTAHRSPLGLVFDNDSVMHPFYRGDAFMLSWTKGLDSCGCTAIPDTGIGPFVDPSQDLIHLDLEYDSLSDNFSLHATRIIEEFEHPVDDAIDSNKIYVLENGYGGTSGLYEVVMPYIPPCAPFYAAEVNYFACDSTGAIALTNSTGYPPYIYTWMDSAGTIIEMDTIQEVTDTIFNLEPGSYSVQINDTFNCSMILPFNVLGATTLSIEFYNLCNSGGAFAVATANGFAPFTYTWSDSDSVTFQSVTTQLETDTLFGIPPGNYYLSFTDLLGCNILDTFIIPEPINLIIDTVIHTTCLVCNDGLITFTAGTNLVSIQLVPNLGNLIGNTYFDLPPGTYIICATDSIGCTSCDTIEILQDPTLINFITSENSIHIFPIPADKQLTIQPGLNHTSIIAAKVYSMTGEIILKKEMLNDCCTLETSTLPDGVYMLKLISKDLEEVRRIVVLHR